MKISFIFQLSLYLLSASLLIQSIELYSVMKKSTSLLVWDWCHIKNDFNHWPKFFSTPLNLVYGQYFDKLILFQIFLTLILPLYPLFSTLLLIFSYQIIALRFRGTFNGGSDFMSMTALLGLTFSQISTFNNSLNPIGFYYLAIHCTFSYFIAGLIKVKNPQWRSGYALQTFLLHSNYYIPNTIRILAQNLNFNKIGSILVIAFECSFPLIWLFPFLMKYYLCAGLLFHLINFYTFGLNRFVFSWFVCYPSLIFCIGK